MNNVSSVVGFWRGTPLGNDLYNGPPHPVFGTWDLLAPIGPITGQGYLLQWSRFSSIETSGGTLIFDDGVAATEFSRGLAGPPGQVYCFGDGSGASCPCSAFGSTGEGCINSAGFGATLAGGGIASVSGGHFELVASGAPGGSLGLLVRGNNQIAAPAGDDILCTGAGVMRSHIQLTVGGTTTIRHFAGAEFGSVSNPGTPTQYQFWYRDFANLCSGAGFNFSNAWTVSFQPWSSQNAGACLGIAETGPRELQST